MKHSYFIQIVLLLSFLSCEPKEQILESQFPVEEIVIGESVSIFSEALGESRQIFLSLPDNYARNLHSYPIVIVFDAEYLFEIINSIVKIKTSRNEMPESIVVGIPNIENQRYDMAMKLSYPDGRTFFGDAEGKKIKNYLSFIRSDLLPYLEKNYRINNHKTVIGMSPTFGPVLEAFWNEPDLFDGYIVLAAELTLT